jgi:hypothetical protein
VGGRMCMLVHVSVFLYVCEYIYSKKMRTEALL